MTTPRTRRAKKSATVLRSSDPHLGQSRRRKHRIVADELGIAILKGKHAPGVVLPSELEASETLGVSRSAYREAIRTLAAKGMVESRPKTGTRVTPRRRWHVLDQDVLAWIFRGEPSQAFIQGIFELRKIVEPQAAALAARRRSTLQLVCMGQALEEMARHGLNTPEGRAADQQFHEEILRATANEPLMALSATIGAAIHWTTVFKQRRHRLPRDPMPEHRQLYDAIADGNGERALQAAQVLIDLAQEDTHKSL